MSRERIAAIVALVLAFPLTFLFTRSMMDGAQRYAEAPLRSMFGNERYAAMMNGEDGFPHYLGDDLAVPDFTLRDRHGETFSMAEHRGRLVVMNFWSIDCPPCIEEMPSVELLAEIAGDRWDDVDVVAVSTDSGWEAVSAILPSSPKLTHLFDPTREVVEGKFGTRLFPETWIVDRNGVIRFRFDGKYDWSSPLVLDVIESLR